MVVGLQGSLVYVVVHVGHAHAVAHRTACARGRQLFGERRVLLGGLRDERHDSGGLNVAERLVALALEKVRQTLVGRKRRASGRLLTCPQRRHRHRKRGCHRGFLGVCVAVSHDHLAHADVLSVNDRVERLWPDCWLAAGSAGGAVELCGVFVVFGMSEEADNPRKETVWTVASGFVVSSVVGALNGRFLPFGGRWTVVGLVAVAVKRPLRAYHSSRLHGGSYEVVWGGVDAMLGLGFYLWRFDFLGKLFGIFAIFGPDSCTVRVETGWFWGVSWALYGVPRDVFVFREVVEVVLRRFLIEIRTI